MTLLASIPDVAYVYGTCRECDAQLMVSPGDSTVLTHNVDGSHRYDPRAEVVVPFPDDVPTQPEPELADATDDDNEPDTYEEQPA